MKVEKIINNNLVKSRNEANAEILVMGRGLGFGKKAGDDIDPSKVEKVYTINDENEEKIESLLKQIPLEVIQVANEIIDYAHISLNKKLNDNIYLSLTDHINFAIERFKKGVPIHNAILWEIKRFYNHEYLIGKEAISIIEKRLGIALPEDEAGFIAFHLVNASMDTEMSKVEEMMKIIADVLNIVKYHFNIELNENSLNYERFINHLKFFIKRIFSETLNDQDNGKFMLLIKEQYPNEYKCALKIMEYFKSKYEVILNDDELIYLTIHIHRITQ